MDTQVMEDLHRGKQLPVYFLYSTDRSRIVDPARLLMDTNVCSLTIYSFCLNTVCFSVESGIYFFRATFIQI